jgi:uncharacterized membrane protein
VPAENGLPTEAHVAILRQDEVVRRALESLKRDEAIRKALEQAAQHPLPSWVVWFAFATAVVLFFPAYLATKDLFVALAFGVSVAALNLAVTIFWAARKMHTALLALLEVSRDKDGRKV